MEENIILALTTLRPNINAHNGKISYDVLKEYASKAKVFNPSLTKVEVEEIYNELIKEYKYQLESDKIVNIPKGINLNDPSIHEKWEPDKNSRFYWNKLTDFLHQTLSKRETEDKALRIIKSIDDETEVLLNNIESPGRSKFVSRGLVIGYVQSGKTANFTGLIAKAADEGYRFFIVLAGVHNILRLQTQIRIDKELTGFNDLNLDDKFVSFNFDSETMKRWQRISSSGSEEHRNKGEFGSFIAPPLIDMIKETRKPIIGIIKKNVSVLKSLITWVKKCPESQRDKISFLLIDDEADQASVDTSANDKKETDPAKTNAKIRELLTLFNKSVYIGYTATPFASVLIGKDNYHEVLKHDLYPSNFIHTLPEPEGYLGNSLIFNGNLQNNFIKVVEENEKATLEKHYNLPKGMIDAILTFYISFSVRILRGQVNKPMSMLIHTNHTKIKQEDCLDIVTKYISSFKSLIKMNKSSSRDRIIELYPRIKTEAVNISKEFNLDYGFPSLNAIIDVLKSDKINDIQLMKLNSDSEDRLDYLENPELKVIAIGGNQLSRGLTLEGLMTTYFIRKAQQYDTLLQMARWFGYRKGYEDLVRIYTTKIIKENFEHLMIVEEELREKIGEYEILGMTPRDFAPVIRMHKKMKVTARNKVGQGKVQGFYGTSIEQTKWLPVKDSNISAKNWSVVESLALDIKDNENKEINGSYLFKNVGLEIVKKFINGFDVYENDLDKADMLRYLEKRKSEMSKWNVSYAGNQEKDVSKSVTFGNYIKVKPISRSRKKNMVKGEYCNIGVLTSPADLKIDLPETSKDVWEKRIRPLLVIYTISGESKAKPGSKNRQNLYLGNETALKRDQVGFAIVFPDSRKKKNEADYIGQIFNKK